VATGGTSNDPSAPITAGRVRVFLGGLTQDPPGPADAALWEVLSSKGALGGSPDRPQLTDIGRQVLRELSIRAYRADGLSLDQAAQEVGQGISTLAAMSDTAQYFLSELGPLPPVEVVPLMRLAAAHLAVRHESPEDLVEEFKNGWGEAEVLGGPPADRLLAAELLTGSGVPQSEIYSAMTRTSETLRDVGCSAAVATAAILHLFPEPNQTPALERWTAIRKSVPSDEGAALLAGLPHPDATLERWRSYLAALSDTDSPDAQRAAIYLTAIRSSLDTQLIAATRAASSRFAPSIASPLLAAALAVSHLGLSPEESFDWQEKSVAQARAHQLAPDGPELAALGLALLEGLDPASFQGRPVTASAISDAAEGVLARTAVHAWIYRHLVRAPPAVARN
jgi:hypothetical protein